jgi:ATP-dependent Lon protease
MPHHYNLRNKNEAQFKSLLQDILPSKHMTKTKKDNSDSETEDSDYETESDSDVNVNITFTIKPDDETEYTDSDEEEDEEEEEEEPVDIVKTDEFIKKVQSIGNDLSDMYKELPIFKEFMKTHKEMEKKQEVVKLNAEKNNRNKNETKFEKLISNKQMSDVKYFATLTTEEQTVLISTLTVLHGINKCQKPSRIQILESDIPDNYKAIALHKVSQLKQGSDGEIGKNRAWLDGFMKIPFGVYHKLPVSLSDGTEKCHAFMENAKQCLDNCTYGLNDAKMQIMQYIGQLISNPIGAGTVIAIEGPMGTGKTTLVKEGISVILQRPFSFIALGGATDSSTLEGHMITYEGSVWGQIADILMRSKCMNPVIYFDELDKVSDTPKGEEIIGILTHLTDSSQNAHFEDKYFMGIGLDLSRATLVFSYNDRSKVNSILGDRMNIIKTEGYTTAQKCVIAKQYLSKSIRQNISFQPEDVIITDAALICIIETYTGREKGVRNLKRCIENIYAKINLFRLMTPGTNLFEEDLSLKVEFPFTVTPEIVRKLLKMDEPKSEMMMYL